jgi:hypothetical protein
MDQFIAALERNRDLEELRLSSFDFNKQMVTHLTNFIVNNLYLKKLNLSWSEFKSEEMIVLIEGIQEVKHLQHLDISTIPIEGPNSLSLVEMIQAHIIQNTSLIHLNMSCCNLDKEKLTVIVEGIKRSKSLLSVHLSGNLIKSDQKHYLLESLMKEKKDSDDLFTVSVPLYFFASP